MMRFKIIPLFLCCLFAKVNLQAQQRSFADTLYKESNRDKVVISPNPIIGGEYFKIKFPERESYKNIELLNIKGERINSSPILFSKMGMYMPNVTKGKYLLKIELSDYTIVKEVTVN